MPSWRPRGPDGSAGSLRTQPSKGCTTFGRRDGRSASIPALGYLVREWWTPSVRHWPTGPGRRRGWPRRSWLMRASMPGRCPPVLPCQATGSARRSSNGCVPGPFGADRYLTKREVIPRPAGTTPCRVAVTPGAPRSALAAASISSRRQSPGGRRARLPPGPPATTTGSAAAPQRPCTLHILSCRTRRPRCRAPGRTGPAGPVDSGSLRGVLRT